ncbi:hypothetical protein Metho_1819 [Methanomethylovorans hollandica DSM 15978]|uniref:Nudix hydrolase domain-containing protein n=1 Tax=Methanomethylovorans hollandica (strain DSM 15978 / NBRC 107637 / DMS1) TaxID=867904 RepID=L0KY02_METHD|nr:NUDIX domain-containing protein [Methanomethylovorans hollandica]AGB50001.1 hypothetical protein Metho_1819 [Methanomethylovorans hollandica DSM 15978]
MKKKILLNVVAKKDFLYQKKSIHFGWKSDISNGIVFQNSNLGVTLYYFAVLNEHNSFEYDTFGIEERAHNCVSVVVNQDGNIGLLKEYRFMPERYFISCPRGFADSDEENRVKCSLREIEEEIGEYQLIESIDLGDLYQNTTFFITPIGVRLVKINISETKKLTELQKAEDINGVSFYSIEDTKNMIRNGKIVCGITLAALAKYFSYIEDKRVIEHFD